MVNLVLGLGLVFIQKSKLFYFSQWSQRYLWEILILILIVLKVFTTVTVVTKVSVVGLIQKYEIFCENRQYKYRWYLYALLYTSICKDNM